MTRVIGRASVMALKGTARNPERRSDAALLCLCIGVGLIVLAWILGLGGLVAAAVAGQAPALAAGGIAALILLPLTVLSGLILALVGGIWLVVRVIADQSEAGARERYDDVER